MAQAQSVVDKVDPYRSLLQVGRPGRPPNPYQLLNLKDLEDKRAKIKSAADRQRARMETVRGVSDEETYDRIRAEFAATSARSRPKW